MANLLANPEFWKAVASLAWPAVALTVFVKLQPVIRALLTRENLTLKIAGMEVTVMQAAESLGAQVADLQEKVAGLQSVGQPNDVVTTIISGSNKKSLLWVDDFPSNNVFIIEKFRQDGIEVTLSIETQEALELLRSRKFDAVITDLGRKELGVDHPMAGLELIRKVRAHGLQTPILVFAGHRGLQHSDQLKAEGATSVTNSGVDVMAFAEKYLGKA
ncbi:response regulator [Aminobacter sp. HY435]|uniref:response regulator n=1 Tax=Aminobacter sp. HY435 TaxID=2970917 RepID=UPI0022B98721|nr:response regulator [Aminobacter sp. HY435]